MLKVLKNCSKGRNCSKGLNKFIYFIYFSPAKSKANLKQSH